MEKILEVIYSFTIFLGLILIALGILYNTVPRSETNDPAESTVIELKRIDDGQQRSA